MKRLFIAFLVGFNYLICPMAAAFEEENARYIRPCRTWTYASNVGGYVCSNPDMSIQIPEAYEVERYIRNLQNQIDELERRLQVLESKEERK